MPLTPASKDGFDSTNGIIYINNDSPVGKYTLKAECDFNRAGKIIIVEGFTNSDGVLTFNTINGTNNGDTVELAGAS